ncbi:MAG: efflux transporter outer membrane subunit [Candidatus Omnitrophica bacterium]|nr:efflux transporter outer membrane subunit [Candidatus Omnitrophota bacterium]
MRDPKIFFLTLLILAVLSGCSLGPSFKKPAMPPGKAYSSGVSKSEPIFVSGTKIPEEWWSLFQSKALDELIRKAIANSPTLVAAQASLRQAQEDYRANVGANYFPQADANLSAARQKTNQSAMGQDKSQGVLFRLYQATVNVSYTFDLWGGARREMESLKAKVDYANFQKEAAYLTLTSNVVAAAGKEVALRGEIEASKEILAAEEDQLAILEKQLSLGGASRFDVLSQRTLVDQTRASLPGMEKELALTRHQLAVLVGLPPGEEATLPQFYMPDIILPKELPIILPSALIEQRPDIKASLALLRAASADVGVATAALLPQITLSGSYGSSENHFEKLFRTNDAIWNFGTGVVQPLFHGGELMAKRRKAQAAYEGALAGYQQTVLLAFQNVADVLGAIESDAVTMQARVEAQASAAQALSLAQKQFQVGALSHLALLTAQRQESAARIDLVQAYAIRFADTASLFQALGGGWLDHGDSNKTGKLNS